MHVSVYMCHSVYTYTLSVRQFWKLSCYKCHFLIILGVDIFNTYPACISWGKELVLSQVCMSPGTEDRYYITETPGDLCYRNKDSLCHYYFSDDLYPCCMPFSDMIFRNLLRCRKKFDWQTGLAGLFYFSWLLSRSKLSDQGSDPPVRSTR